MFTLRRLARGLLQTVVRHSPPDREEWVSAMLRELDFIENDWEALLWATGGTATMLRDSGRRIWVENRFRDREGKVNSTGKNALGIASGIGLALLFAVIVVTLRVWSSPYFPNLEAGRVPWRLWLFVMVIPETVLVVAAITLWRKKRPVATGILVTALAIGVHIAVHIAHHWHG